MQFALKYKAELVFAALIALVCISSQVHEHLSYPPASMHYWRQSDCASQALNYYQNDRPFLCPQGFNLIGEDGAAASEFPILYYLTGKIYHLTGPKAHWVLRSMTLGLFLWGIWCFFLSCRHWLKNPWWAMLPPLLLLTSPYLFFYANNFLPNIPGLGLSFVGLWYVVKYYRDERLLNLYLAGVIFALSGLIKITDGGIVFCAVFVMFLAEWAGCSPFGAKANRQHAVHKMVISAVIFCAWAAWSLYAKYYNETHHAPQNLIGIYPIWEMTRQEIWDTMKMMFYFWQKDYQHKNVIRAIIVMLPLSLWLWPRIQPVLKWFFGLVFLAVAAYCVLWFKAFLIHDYYQMPLALLSAFLCLAFIDGIGKVGALQKKWIYYTGCALGLLLAGSGIKQCARRQWERYHNPVYFSQDSRFFSIEPYLRSLGIRTTDKIYSVPDKTINFALYGINSPGWSAFNLDGKDVEDFVRMGCQYIIISDTSWLNKPQYKPFLNHEIGDYYGVKVFKVERN